MASNHLESDQAFSGVAQTANVGTSTSVSSGAAKIFREFKWGLLTLFILMAVVVGLVYDGGRNKKKTETVANPNQKLDAGLGLGELGSNLTDNSNNGGGNTNPSPAPAPNPNGGNGPVSGGLGGGNTPVTGGGVDPLGTLPSRGRAHLLDDNNDAWSPAPIPNQPITRPSRGSNGTNPQGPSRGAGADEPNAMHQDNGSGHEAAPTRPNTGRGETRPTQPGTRTAPESNAGKIYVVKAGDSLSKISSSNQLGKNGVKMILDANKETLTNPDRLREGMKLKIPASGSTAQNSVSEQTPRVPANSNSGRVIAPENRGTAVRPASDMYVVQAGDSLERIARRVLKDGNKWKELLDWNKDKLSDPTKLKVGMALRTSPGGGAAAPATNENYRYQNNPVRAENDILNDAPLTPEAEVVPIPISPVSASRKISMPVKGGEVHETPGSRAGTQLPEPDNLMGN